MCNCVTCRADYGSNRDRLDKRMKFGTVTPVVSKEKLIHDDCHHTRCIQLKLLDQLMTNNSEK